MTLTFFFTIGMALLVVGVVSWYDVWTIRKRGWQTSISYVLWYVSIRYPIVPFTLGYLFGVLSGHLWWQYFPDPGLVEKP